MSTSPRLCLYRPDSFVEPTSLSLTPVDPIAIIEQYYPTDSDRYRILTTHSYQVAEYALQILTEHPELGCDARFVYEAAMLHDIGIFLTDAPGIDCHGEEPYLRHGYLGGVLLHRLGLEQHALVCERHTGSGLTSDDIIAQGLDLPLDRTYLPQNTEEQVICYADKFFSKTHLAGAKPLDRVRRSLERFGQKSLDRFEAMHRLFAIE